jgi:mRNA interferase RelE/StbE
LYSISILDDASRQLKHIDKAVGQRIVQRVNWLAENLETAKLEALTGDFAGLFKLRIGSYRVLYEILREEQIIVIHAIGHRREIYSKRLK